MTCLSVSTDGSVLLSGSHDETVRLWDVQSQQCLRTVTLKGGRGRHHHSPTPGRAEEGLRACLVEGTAWLRVVLTTSPTPPPGPVTNACIMLAPVSMLSSDFRPGLPLPHFNKHLLGAEHGDEPHHGGLMLRLGLHQQVCLTWQGQGTLSH